MKLAVVDEDTRDMSEKYVTHLESTSMQTADPALDLLPRQC